MKYEAPYTAATRATLHALSGVAIGETLGIAAGMSLGMTAPVTILLATSLAGFVAYGLAMLPLIRARLSLGSAFTLAIAADSLPIIVMTGITNIVLLLIPESFAFGMSLLLWASLTLALSVGFVVTLSLLIYALKRGPGRTSARHYRR